MVSFTAVLIAALADNAMGLSLGVVLEADGRHPERGLITTSLAIDFLGRAELGQWLEVDTSFIHCRSPSGRCHRPSSPPTARSSRGPTLPSPSLDHRTLHCYSACLFFPSGPPTRKRIGPRSAEGRLLPGAHMRKAKIDGASRTPTFARGGAARPDSGPSKRPSRVESARSAVPASARFQPRHSTGLDQTL